ncbi:MAG: hypothetical protein WBC97_10720 [Gemmatimonadales bacterium]
MPVLSTWFVRTALLELLAGFLLGALMLATRGHTLALWAAPLLPLHIELLVLGWLANLALGVAYWILPKHASGPERGRRWPVIAAWCSLNAGVLLAGLHVAPGLGRAAELGAVMLFAAHALPRVKAFGVGRGIEPGRGQR